MALRLIGCIKKKCLPCGQMPSRVRRLLLPPADDNQALNDWNAIGSWSRSTDHAASTSTRALFVYCCAHGCTNRTRASFSLAQNACDLAVHCGAYGWTSSSWAVHFNRHAAAPPCGSNIIYKQQILSKTWRYVPPSGIAFDFF